MKKWLNPEVEVLNVNETACGGRSVTEHDGCIYQIKVGDKDVSVEEYYPASGESCACGAPR